MDFPIRSYRTKQSTIIDATDYYSAAKSAGNGEPVRSGGEVHRDLHAAAAQPDAPAILAHLYLAQVAPGQTLDQGRHDLVGQASDPAKLRAMRAIKSALDPQGIMNPGAVLPNE